MTLTLTSSQAVCRPLSGARDHLQSGLRQISEAGRCRRSSSCGCPTRSSSGATAPSTPSPTVAMISLSTRACGPAAPPTSSPRPPRNSGLASRASPSTARCNTTPLRSGRSARLSARAVRWPGERTSSSSPTWTPATPPAKLSSAAPTLSASPVLHGLAKPVKPQPLRASRRHHPHHGAGFRDQQTARTRT